MRSFLHGRHFPLISLSCLLAFSLACSEKPKVNKDSPDLHYADAKKALADVKFEKAISLTGEVLSKYSGSEYADRARILRIILMAGLSEGYRSMADAYLAGYEKSIKNAGQFRSSAFDYYRKQKSVVLSFYEASDFFLKNYSETTPYVLDCDFPSKDVTINRGIDDIRAGKLITPELLKVTDETELQNKVILTLCSFVGAGEDRAKARKQLEGGPKNLEHSEFMVTLGRTLLDNYKLFGRQALNDPTNFKQFVQKAKESSELAQKLLKDKPNKETKERADRLKLEIDAIDKKLSK
jgi:hypothetical protein